MQTRIDFTEQTQTTLAHHLHSLLEYDLDAILSDYTEASVLSTPAGIFSGLGALRAFFSQFIQTLTPEFLSGFYLNPEDIQGECISITWSSGSAAPLGTVTFLVREGKILEQSFAAYSPP